MNYPKYESHKVVSAAKITGSEKGADGALTVHLEGFDSVVIPHHEAHKKPTPFVGGYLVVYQDGYISFSPAKAFEEGYTLIPEFGGTAAEDADNDEWDTEGAERSDTDGAAADEPEPQQAE